MLSRFEIISVVSIVFVDYCGGAWNDAIRPDRNREHQSISGRVVPAVLPDAVGSDPVTGGRKDGRIGRMLPGMLRLLLAGGCFQSPDEVESLAVRGAQLQATLEQLQRQSRFIPLPATFNYN